LSPLIIVVVVVVIVVDGAVVGDCGRADTV
jgi:hypothetical protein